MGKVVFVIVTAMFFAANANADEAFPGPHNIHSVVPHDGYIRINFGDGGGECLAGESFIEINTDQSSDMSIRNFDTVAGCTAKVNGDREDAAGYLADVTIDYMQGGFLPIGLLFENTTPDKYMADIGAAYEASVMPVSNPPTLPRLVFIPLVVVR